MRSRPVQAILPGLRRDQRLPRASGATGPTDQDCRCSSSTTSPSRAATRAVRPGTVDPDRVGATPDRYTTAHPGRSDRPRGQLRISTCSDQYPHDGPDDRGEHEVEQHQGKHIRPALRLLVDADQPEREHEKHRDEELPGPEHSRSTGPDKLPHAPNHCSFTGGPPAHPKMLRESSAQVGRLPTIRNGTCCIRATMAEWPAADTAFPR